MWNPVKSSSGGGGFPDIFISNYGITTQSPTWSNLPFAFTKFLIFFSNASGRAWLTNVNPSTGQPGNGTVYYLSNKNTPKGSGWGAYGSNIRFTITSNSITMTGLSSQYSAYTLYLGDELFDNMVSFS